VAPSVPANGFLEEMNTCPAIAARTAPIEGPASVNTKPRLPKENGFSLMDLRRETRWFVYDSAVVSTELMEWMAGESARR
jgi:hypothetical protein